jgi:hypothetical protein
MLGMRRLIGAALRRAGVAVLTGGTAPDVRRLRKRFRVAEDWREPVGDRAPRLDASTTISVRRVGRLREVDPLRTVEGWRNPRKVLAVGVLLGWIGGAAALGWWGRRGPLAAIRRPEAAAEDDPATRTDVGPGEGGGGLR